MSKLSFEIAVKDKEAAKKDRAVQQLQVLAIGGQDYAVVRPSPGTLMMLLQVTPSLRDLLANDNTHTQGVGVIVSFFEETMKPAALRAALADSGEYGDDEDDLGEDGEELASSNSRLISRFIDRNDDLGEETLANVVIGLTEEWAGNPTGSPVVSSPTRRRTGAKSTASSSRKVSTSSRSSTSRRRAS